MRTLTTTIVLIFIINNLWGEVRLSPIFTDNMVLQRDSPIRIWGWAEEGEEVRINFNGEAMTVLASDKGEWKTELKPMTHGGPYKLIVQGSNKIELDNIMIGDVWICSGQSNMYFPLKGTNNAEYEIANANFPEIRLYQVPYIFNKTPQEDYPVEILWQQCSLETVKDFSAVAYFFGKELFQKYSVPIGLINVSVGASSAEAWMSEKTLRQNNLFIDQLNWVDSLDFKKYKIQSEKWQFNFQDARKKFIAEIQEKDQGKEFLQTPELMNEMFIHAHEVKLPGFCESNMDDFQNFDGILWYKKTFHLDKNQLVDNYTLELGIVDDSDMVWLNGQKIGETFDDKKKYRRYKIDNGVFNEGENTIIIRVLDYGGNGGIADHKSNLFLKSNVEEISLRGNWEVTIGTSQSSPLTKLLNEKAMPSFFYNGMLYPLIPLSIKGTIWYQGETNADRAFQYKSLFPMLINQWRADFGLGNFPFLFVQLANFNRGSLLNEWAELRMAQTKALSLPNTAMIVTYDVGDPDNIHPKDKQTVGKRLALAAQKVAYSENVLCSGPVFKEFEIIEDRMVVSFDNVGKGLIANDKYGYLKGFELAGDDGVFHWAKASILKENVIVWSEKVLRPNALRYAWEDNPEDANLYNADGLPAIPFRTGKWEWNTKRMENQ